MIYKSILKVIFISLFIFSCSKNNKEITILHLNDTHGRNAQDMKVNKETDPPTTNYFAGASRRASYIENIRNEKPNTIVLHGGDLITGSAFSTVYQGMDEINIMNAIGFDVSTVGNHEFDYGLDNFKKLIANSDFEFVSANIKDENTGEYFVNPYTILNVDGVSIAIIGLTTSDAVYNPEMLEHLKITEEINALKNLLSEIPLNETNDITILLSHVGLQKDKEIATSMTNVFDIIVGGHSHTQLDKEVVVGNTKIVQASYYGLYVGEINLTLNDKNKIKSFSYNLIPMDENVKEDEGILKIVTNMQKEISKEFDIRIATLPIYLEHDNIRLEGKPLGNFASDLVLDSYSQADLVLMNSGALRTALPEGTITLGKIQNEFFPYDNTVILVDLPGHIIKEMISLSGKKIGSGAFLQYSRGMKVVYDKNGNLITVTLNDKPIEDNKFYKVIVSSFIYNGGDGYVDSDGNPLSMMGENIVDTGNDMRDAMIQNIKELNNIPLNYIDQNERIIFN